MIFLNISFSTLICIFYFLGSFDISGEAIVRVSTLNVAVFLIYFLGKSDLNLKDIATPLLYIVGTQLFFLNTVFFGF